MHSTGAETLLLPAPSLLEPLPILPLATFCCSFRSPLSCYFLQEAVPDRLAESELAGPAASAVYSSISALIPGKQNGLFNVPPLSAELGLESPSVSDTRGTCLIVVSLAQNLVQSWCTMDE